MWYIPRRVLIDCGNVCSLWNSELAYRRMNLWLLPRLSTRNWWYWTHVPNSVLPQCFDSTQCRYMGKNAVPAEPSRWIAAQHDQQTFGIRRHGLVAVKPWNTCFMWCEKSSEISSIEVRPREVPADPWSCTPSWPRHFTCRLTNSLPWRLCSSCGPVRNWNDSKVEFDPESPM